MPEQSRPTPRARRIPLPPLRQVLRLGSPTDIWHKPALSAVAAVGAVNLTLLALGRLDLALYTMAGCLCALYGHGLPYPARARTVAGVAAGTLLSTAVALTAASLTHSVAALVVVCAVLAALHKLACEAGRVGPPGALIVTFTSTTCAFVPQRLAEVPAHLALTALGAAVAWLVCMAPALVRPFGPERILTARALEAAARLLSGGPDRRPAARAALAAAVNAARHTLAPAPAAAEPRRQAVAGLQRLLVRSESALASTPIHTDTGADTDADTARRYRGWARDLRRNRPLPVIELTAAEAAELREAAEAAAPTARRPSRWHALRPGSPLLPITLRVALGCAAAGWASMAMGVGRPGWAVVTAASIYQASAGLSWQRALQRVLGNLLGLLVFTALLPVSSTGQLALVLLALACNFATEATIARSYWLASAFVTPMALLMTEFAHYQDARSMVTDRWLDTCLGALFGLAACLVVTNRRTSTRLDRALTALLAATESARTAVAPAPPAVAPAPPAVAPAPPAVAARRRLSHALVELREAADIASGEWRQRALPQLPIAQAEREGHGQLAAMLDRRGHESSPACP
ncbi:FUSC family protein [Kitasatospora griseola]|uniref:FUSC family protein n=1 Tax=Kitasatospora griseola TaxID=2064 RepID=UPI0036DDBFA7